MTAALLVGEGLVLLVLVVLVAGLLRSHAEILRSLQALGAGIDPDRAEPAARAPGGLVALGEASRTAADLMGETVEGDPLAVAVAGTAHDTLLLFLSSGCGTCLGFWDSVRRGVPEVPGRARLVVVAKSPADESLSTLRRLAPADVPLVLSTAAFDDYGVPGSPYAVYVAGGPGLVVGEGTATTWAQTLTLMAQAVADGHHPA